jgi:hypothetical protein
MFLNHRNDLFKVEFPKVFIPKSIKDKYRPYLAKLPNLFSDDVSDVVNYSIKNVTIPNLNYDPVQQITPGYDRDFKKGKTKRWRSAISKDELYDKTFEVTMGLLDGQINYWIMFETFLWYYEHSNRAPYAFDFPVRILDTEGNLIYSIIFVEVLFVGISEFVLSFAEPEVDQKEFDLTFEFNQFRTILENDG